LLADYDPETTEVTVFDVHPKKYGRSWKCTAEALFNAMADKDSSSARARGLIRLVKISDPAPLQYLSGASRSLSWNHPEYFKLPHDLFHRAIGNFKLAEPGRNVGDVVSIAECGLACLCNDSRISVDDVLHETGDYLKILSSSLSSQILLEIAHSYIQARKLPAQARILQVQPVKESILEVLKELGKNNKVICMKMNDNLKVGSSVLTPPDPSQEASIFNNGIHNWNSVIGLTSDHEHVVILNPQFIVFSRVIRITVNALVAAVIDTMKTTNQEHIEVIILEKV